MKQAKVGDRFQDLITTSWFNGQNKRKNPPPNAFSLDGKENPIKVPCHAAAGIDLARFDAANIVGPAIPYEDFDGDAVQYSTASVEINGTLVANRWGIVQGPCLPDNPTTLVVSGITWANFDYTNGHTHVDIVGGALVSTTEGPALILSPPESAGKPGLILIRGETLNLDDHFLFTLAEDMSGSSALAEIRTMDDLTQVEASEEVVNTLGDFSHLLTDDRGICVKVDDVYYAVHPEAIGGVTSGHVFTLTSTLARGHGQTASATVIRTGESGVIVSDTITVTNTGDKLGPTGAVGWAVKIGAQYWVVEIDQYPIRAIGLLNDDTHTFSSGSTYQGKVADQKANVSIASLVSNTPYPFNFIPSPLPTITNPYNLIGLSGDQGVITYNEDEDEWQLVEILPQEKRRFRFKLTANMGVNTITSTDEYVPLETREFTSGEMPLLPNPPDEDLYDPQKLIVDGKTNDEGVAEYSYKDEQWQVISFRRRDKHHIEGTLDSLTTPETGHYTGLVVGSVTVTESTDPDLIGTSVDVVDHSGCVFDLPIGDLEDVRVWASEKYSISLDTELDPNTITPLHFCADDRCCVAADVGEFY